MSLLTLSLIALASLADDPVTNPKFASAPQDGEAATSPAEDGTTPAEAEPEPPKWTGDLTFGSSVTGGNTDIKKSSLTADAIKNLKKSRYTLGFIWTFSEEDDVISQRRVFGSGQFDRFITDRMYWLAQLSGESDLNASVDLRTTVGGGLGYQFLDNEKWKLSGEAGLSYLDERFATDEDNDYVALRAAYKVDWIPNSAWSVGQAIQVFPSLEDAEDVYAKADTRLKVNISGSLFAQLQWVFDWNNTPAAGKERVDNLYLLTIGWKF
jgi:putative salt-induced outer membrane protein YdiY